MLLTQTSLGIAVSEHIIELTLLEKNLKGLRLLHTASYHIKGAPASAEERTESLIAALNSFLLECPARPEEVVVTVPRQAASFRVIEIPALNKDQLPQIMQFEAPRHVPFPVEQAYIDHCLIGTNARGMLEVLFVAIKREVLDIILQACNVTSLPPALVDMFGLGAVNLLLATQPPTDPAHARVLVGLGAQELTYTLLIGNRLNNSRTSPLPPAVRQYFQAVHGTTGKPTSGSFEAPPVDLDALVVTAAETIVKNMQVFLSSSGLNSDENEIQDLFFYGPNAVDPAFERAFFEAAQMPFLLLRPMAHENQSRLTDEYLPAIAESYGLALRGLEEESLTLNLLPKELRRRKVNYAKVLLIALVVANLGLASAWGAMTLGRKSELLSELRTRNEEMEPLYRRVSRARQDLRSLQNEIETFRNIKGSTPSSLDILRELTERIDPEDRAWLTQMKYKDDKMTISGEANSPESLVPSLEDAEIFYGVKLGDVRDKQFRIDLKLKAPALTDAEVEDPAESAETDGSSEQAAEATSQTPDVPLTLDAIPDVEPSPDKKLVDESQPVRSGLLIEDSMPVRSAKAPAKAPGKPQQAGPDTVGSGVTQSGNAVTSPSATAPGQSFPSLEELQNMDPSAFGTTEDGTPITNANDFLKTLNESEEMEHSEVDVKGKPFQNPKPKPRQGR